MAALTQLPLPFLPTATYRSADPVENLVVRVTLRKKGTADPAEAQASPSHLRSSPSTRKLSPAVQTTAASQDSSLAATGTAPAVAPPRRRGSRFITRRNSEDEDAEAVEMQPLRNEEHEEDRVVATSVFRWQQKVFAPHEVAHLRKVEEMERSAPQATGWRQQLFGRAQPASSFVQMQQLDALRSLDEAARAQGEAQYHGDLLYTRVDSEGDHGAEEWDLRFTTSKSEEVTPLARAVLSGAGAQEHRDLLGEAACVSMAVLAELPAEEMPGARSRSRQSVLRRFRSTANSQAETDDAEARLILTLLTMHLYPGGRLDVRPPFSTFEELESEEGGRWHSIPDSRFDFMVENLGEVHDAEAEQLLLHAEAQSRVASQLGRRLALGAIDFNAPPAGVARVCQLVQLEMLRGFGPEKVSVQYFAHAAPGWRLLAGCSPTGTTQMAVPKGADETAVLAFPLEMVLESTGPPTAARAPLTLFLLVCQQDVSGRRAVAAYSHFEPPAFPGSAMHEVFAFELVQSRSDALRSFFVGGSCELRDLRALGIPENFQDRCLNKHGLQTRTVGSIIIRTSTSVQQSALVAQSTAREGGTLALAANTSANARSRSTLKALLGARSLGSTETAADRVRRRLQERRERERDGERPGAPSPSPGGRAERGGRRGGESGGGDSAADGGSGGGGGSGGRSGGRSGSSVGRSTAAARRALALASSPS